MSGWNLADVPPAATLTPYALRCEHLGTPRGVGVPVPRLSWRLASDRRGDAQAAFRVTVRTATGAPALPQAGPLPQADVPARDSGRIDGVPVWDSGWIDGQDVSADYGGAPLTSFARYAWRVEVRAADGTTRAAESWFGTGVLHADEWAAAWIGHDPETEPPFEPPTDDREPRTVRTAHLPAPRHFRREVRLRPATAIRIACTARGLYELRVNGHRVGDGELTPGWTEYHRRVPYQVYDVTDLAGEGPLCVGAVLADGWWSGSLGWDGRQQAQRYGRQPQLLVQLVAEHADGSRTVIGTDGSWRETTGPRRYADLLMGEWYDARLELHGWDLPGFDDSSWAPARVTDTDLSVLVPSAAEPVRVTQDLVPVETFVRDGRTIVDLGQNIAGRVRVTLRGAAPGTRVTLRHGEALSAGGDLYTGNLRSAEATDHYVAAGRAEETFEPRFTVHGFRYVELTTHLPGELPGDAASDLNGDHHQGAVPGDRADGLTGSRAPDIEVTGRAMHSDTPVAGEFTCSDATVNRLMSNIRWSQRDNFVSVPTDCPQRDERLGWTADAQVFLPTACYNADVAAFFTGWLADLRCAQDAVGGAVPDVVPHVMTERHGTPGWGDAATVVPWHLYRVYGDERVLRDSLPSMRRWVDHVERHNPGLVWRHRVGSHYGDWLQAGVRTSRDVMATAYFALSADLTARAAHVLGDLDTHSRYAGLRARIGEAFAREFVAPDGRITGDTQTGYLLALAHDLVPAGLVPAAVGHLVADLERRGRRLTTGFAGVGLLGPVLSAHGHADLAYALLHDDRYPSWGYSIKRGATTIWERWDGWTEEAGFGPVAMNSFNHYALGSVGAWLYGGVAGLGQRDDSAGFRRPVVRPLVGGLLRWASAAYETPLGRLGSRWELDGDTLRLEVRVPPGALATVHVPTTDPASVRSSGRPVTGSPATDPPSVRPSGTPATGPALVCEVGSGLHTFTATWRP
ncbi:glycoside hydrolase family 78 protein [Nonomuraea fuscirosea]|uniref:alpha-L-rhamnosidase n=1 Tax=Nonomuraea fuscirosea TaxID=1291556 RepID=UPI002DDA3C85|nr:family 78 glycoside hydrolase catalytic domain [Nonomuraea fuscirosea]WSA48908.1 glycoside hydrolase family 78 protein [Nonomuraea fuscirosea]